jgi:uncharacterized repeat protein (TIGR01451 family)
MVRSMTKRGMPKPFAILIAAVLALYFVPLGALPASATEPALGLEGCRGSAADFPASGPFVCPDDEYTSGNLQKLWNELDLVPHRVTSTASASDDFPFTTTLAADYLDNGNKGYDVISVPVVNDALSDDSCEITNVGPMLLDQPSLGGSDFTIRRDITWTQDPNTVCVFDYYQRLALGAAEYEGSNLQSYLGVDNGKKTVPLPVGAILPQSISKTMTATQGSSYTWTVDKNANPTSVNFADTCEQSTDSKTANVSITVNWTRSAKLASGDISLTTVVTAHNPAHRPIRVNVSDQMYAGSGQANPLGAPQTGSAVVDAGGEHDFTFTKTVSSNATTFNDVATATYTDEATNIPVPGTTTASATATVTDSGTSSGASATISDVESITGAGFSYKVNSVTPNEGSFGTYTLGTNTTGNVTWTNTISPAGTGAASGSFVFAKTITVAAGTVGSGSLADTVTLTPAGQSAKTANASVALTANAANPTLQFKKTVDIAPTSDAIFTFTVRAKDAQGQPTGDTYTFSVTVLAGQTSGTSDVKSVAPSANGYVYTETSASGYDQKTGSIEALAKCDVKLVEVTNARLKGGYEVHKSFDPADVAGASTEFTVEVDCDGTAYDSTLVLNEAHDWTDGLDGVPTGVHCTVSEPTVPAGWDPEGITIDPDEFTIQEAGQTVQVTVTNTRLFGRITVAKNLVGAANGASTSFTFDVDCPGTAYDQALVVNVTNGSSASATTGLIPTGVTCTVTERSTPDWNLTSVAPAGGVVTVPATVTFTNTRKQGVLNVSKAVSPVAGGGVVVEFGDTLTYTLTVSATGEATQHDVKVSDYIPGYDPARPTSGKTTYVAGSATCVGAGTCTVTGPDSAHQLTWALGDMAPGTTRQVTFKVTIDDVSGAAGETVAVDILNAGAVESRETPKKPSNQVVTPVSKVLPVKVSKPPVVVLPHTGSSLPVGPTVGGAIALLGLGLLLMVAAGRRRSSWMPRR